MTVNEKVATPEEKNEQTKKKPAAPVAGEVVDCAKLNVRSEPDAEATVLTEILAGTEVRIDKDGSNKAFFKVTTPTGIDGFCMKKYIKIK